MDAWRLRRLARDLPTRSWPPVAVDDRLWQLVSVDAENRIMRQLEALPVRSFTQLASLRAQSVTRVEPQTAACCSLVIIGDPEVGMRRAFMEPGGQPYVCDYMTQERVQAVLADAAFSPGVSDTPHGGRGSLPVTDALIRLVLRELLNSGPRAHEVTVAARLGLPHARVVEVLDAAAARGFVEQVPQS